MLFDFIKRKKKKMSKHLIGIDAEVYILYEDKVLLKSREKQSWLEAPLLFSFSFYGWHPSVMNRTAVISSIKILILFLVQEKKENSISFLDLNPSFETVISRFSHWLFLASCIHNKAFDEQFLFHHCLILRSTSSVGNMYDSCNKKKKTVLLMLFSFYGLILCFINSFINWYKWP